MRYTFQTQLPNMIHLSDRSSIYLNSNLSWVDTSCSLALWSYPYLCVQCDRQTKLPASTAAHPKTSKVLHDWCKVNHRTKQRWRKRETMCFVSPFVTRVRNITALQKEEGCLHSISTSLSALGHMTNRDGARISKSCILICFS